MFGSEKTSALFLKKLFNYCVIIMKLNTDITFCKNMSIENFIILITIVTLEFKIP